MSGALPRAHGPAVAHARFKSRPEDFRVYEELGFEPGGEGEHVFLHLEKCQLNTPDLAQRISSLSGIHPKDISYSGMKDRQAVTRQWFSVRMAGKTEPDWQSLAEEGVVEVLAVTRHQRKLKRGVHRGNRFRIVLRELQGDRDEIVARLDTLRAQGAPNYFGEQRFGREGSTLAQARGWSQRGARRISRNKRSLYFSALRSHLFNLALASRVARDSWNRIEVGDTCMLQGTRSLFTCEAMDASIEQRAATGDLHPGLPMWGRGGPACYLGEGAALAEEQAVCKFLEEAGLELAWRPARLIADDFCWQFCDDDVLQLDFRLGVGSYATALLAELLYES
ncbi:tRNA pseudouridine(13) synthase TruD [Halioglobus maricola]|uniref:tRNA pseudouridine synthase D n=1 Tax=Halioglobus maricola TaxID=2601894 RepID=A0A5P9NKP7_9GAMM|nr:tRNA pseudouridine(13) synthase TruD [Halioglobus maricola]QFU75528.1 tRNA pseudouridine(13) synthase TruD [Halioglobus maricola]